MYDDCVAYFHTYSYNEYQVLYQPHELPHPAEISQLGMSNLTQIHLPHHISSSSMKENVLLSTCIDYLKCGLYESYLVVCHHYHDQCRVWLNDMDGLLSGDNVLLVNRHVCHNNFGSEPRPFWCGIGSQTLRNGRMLNVDSDHMKPSSLLVLCSNYSSANQMDRLLDLIPHLVNMMVQRSCLLS